MSIRESVPAKQARILFISDQVQPKLVAYIFGQAGVYVDHVAQLGTNMVQVAVRYSEEADMEKLLQAKGPARVYRIEADCTYVTKSGEPHMWTDRSSQFLDAAARRILPIVKGRTVCVFSDDKPLRNAFYRSVAKINTEGGFGCSFDYNQYDDRIVLRQISLPPKKHSRWCRYRILVCIDQYTRKMPRFP